MVAHVVRLRREARGVGDAAAPRVVEVERGAVVDQPEVAVPDQQVGVAPAAVDVGDERVQPERPRGDVGRDLERRVEAEGAGQEVDAQVEAQAGVEQVLHLLVGLVAGDPLLELQHHQSRRAQVEPERQLADDHLGDQHGQALAGATELADVGAQVVGLDDAGERSALAQRCHVAGRTDLLQDASSPSSRLRCSATSYSGFGHSSRIPRRASRSSWPTAQLRYHLRSLGTTYQGAASVLQRSSAIS